MIHYKTYLLKKQEIFEIFLISFLLKGCYRKSLQKSHSLCAGFLDF
jgi:hypothetical protein